MKKVGVAILGLGVVGGGTYKILTDNREFFKKSQEVDVSVENVLEINADRVKALGIDSSIVAKNIEEVVSNPMVDIVIEVMGGTTFAKDFGISESTIRNWIRNGNMPSAEIVYNMAVYFGVPMEYLLNGTESKVDDADFVMLLKMKKLSAEQKKMLIAVADSLINQKDN